MRISIIINDQTIMEDILFELENMETSDEIRFPDDDAKQEFADEIADTIITQCENDADFLPTWSEIWNAVHDAAQDSEYTI